MKIISINKTANFKENTYSTLVPQYGQNLCFGESFLPQLEQYFFLRSDAVTGFLDNGRIEIVSVLNDQSSKS